MHFCDECRYMLYPSMMEGKLYERCKNCGFKKENTNYVVHSRDYKGHTYQDQYSKRNFPYDVTLARTANQPCPNDECPSKKDSKLQEAVYWSTKDSMKLTYICVQCNTEWRYN